MNVTIILEHRFDRTPDGLIWTMTQSPYQFWTRYLVAFSHVQVVARVRDVVTPQAGSKRADGPGVSFCPVPDYQGPLGLIRRYSSVRSSVRRALATADAVIMRVPSVLAIIAQPMLSSAARPYALEVVGDPYDVFAPGGTDYLLRPFFRHGLAYTLRKQCWNAAAVKYVTSSALQRRYPCPNAVTAGSDVDLTDDCFCERDFRGVSSDITIALVGSLEQLYKGPDVLIRAVAVCLSHSVPVKLVIAGDGRYRPMLESLSQSLNVADRVTFLGQLSSGEPIWRVLDSSDLFVLPSRAEGLPRAMIEAMARSLPCIGSTVGGIPELLTKADLVPPDDIEALAARICDFTRDPQLRYTSGCRNFRKALEYTNSRLTECRNRFYMDVQRTTGTVPGRVEEASRSLISHVDA